VRHRKCRPGAFVTTSRNVRWLSNSNYSVPETKKTFKKKPTDRKTRKRADTNDGRTPRRSNITLLVRAVARSLIGVVENVTSMRPTRVGRRARGYRFGHVIIMRRDTRARGTCYRNRWAVRSSSERVERYDEWTGRWPFSFTNSRTSHGGKGRGTEGRVAR